MTSDEERREVARRLREMGEELGSSVLLWYHIAKILGVRTATDGKTACDMLADLIDPQTSEQNNHDESILSDSPIDRGALLELADEISRCRYLSARACEETHRGWADRIRKAIGED